MQDGSRCIDEATNATATPRTEREYRPHTGRYSASPSAGLTHRQAAVVEGRTTLTGEEMKWLHGAFEDITQEILQLRRLNSGFAEALYRKRLQLTHTDNPDGSVVSFDLQPAPPDAEPPPMGDAPVSMN